MPFEKDKIQKEFDERKINNQAIDEKKRLEQDKLKESGKSFKTKSENFLENKGALRSRKKTDSI